MNVQGLVHKWEKNAQIVCFFLDVDGGSAVLVVMQQW
jgi:hypothetical protein